MSTINGLGSTDPIQQLANNPINKSISTETSDPSATPPRAADRLELSGVNYLFQSLQANNVRSDLVSSVRSQIEAGTYETDDKLDTAADKVLDELTK